MRVSKTTQDEISELSHFMNELGWLYDDLKISDFDQISFGDYEIFNGFDNTDPERFLLDLLRYARQIPYSKILMNCSTLLDNCADPELDHLDFNSDIKRGLELLELEQSGPGKVLQDLHADLKEKQLKSNNSTGGAMGISEYELDCVRTTIELLNSNVKKTE